VDTSAVRVLLSGYYGFGNLGDEALLDVIVSQMRERFPYATIDVLSATPEETAHHFRVEATPRWDMRRIGDAIVRSDIVLSGGGGLLQSATSLKSLAYYTGIISRAAKAKRKTMIFAQSIGPLDMIGRFVVREGCKGVLRATVRDGRSRELLASLLPATPVVQTADPVFLYDKADDDASLAREGFGDAGGPIVVVSVRKHSAFHDGVPAIARAVDRLSEHFGARVAFVPLGGIQDAEASTAVIRKCESAPLLLPEPTPSRASALIRRSAAVIGMRLHALILAARWGVPFLAIPYDPKVSALAEDLAYPLEPLWVPGRAAPPSATVDARVDRLMSERAVLAEHLVAQARSARAAAARNFDVFAELARE
jgi:polysaccharide pyruvyl transferase CsaB